MALGDWVSKKGGSGQIKYEEGERGSTAENVVKGGNHESK